MELKRLKELKKLYERPSEQELEKEQEELLNEINYVLQLHIPVVRGSFKIQVQTENRSFYVCVLANGQDDAEAKVKREYPDAKHINSISAIIGNPIF